MVKDERGRVGKVVVMTELEGSEGTSTVYERDGGEHLYGKDDKNIE